MFVEKLQEIYGQCIAKSSYFAKSIYKLLGSRLSALGSRLSALGSRLSALGSRLSALGSRLSALTNSEHNIMIFY
ncbi:MAG: hypothetical protein LBR45_03880 [Bacteroidales bacterium]|jgi:hypothetical protein|nr:hypothetical protein [Bacteroidales bacterium]